MSTDTLPQPALSATERRELRARAHPLHPLVMISSKGASPAVLAEIERALAHHELIKIRVMDADRDERDAMMERVCAATGAQPVQHIGKILIVYRHNPASSTGAVETARVPDRRKPRTTDKNGNRGVPSRAKGDGMRVKRGTTASRRTANAAPPGRFVSEARRQSQQRRKPSR